MGHTSSPVSRTPGDAITFTASSALLIVVAAVSSFIPLTRIARLDPVVLLRAE